MTDADAAAGAPGGTAAPTPTVAVIGLGSMGGRIACRLVAQGHAVSGLDARPGRAAELGLTAAPDLAAAAAADIVLLSLPSSREVEQVVAGAGGLAEHARPGLLVVDLTTAEPASTRRLQALLAARGVDLLDAGISGGTGPAETGTLTLMIGGDPASLERALPVLRDVGSTLVHLGGPGNGHAAKAVNNFLNAMHLAATAEAMVVGAAAGLDPAQLLAVIQQSSGRSFASEVRFPRIVAGDYMAGSLSSALLLKDLGVYEALASSAGVTAAASLLEPARALYEAALAAGLGEASANHVVDVIGDRAGGIRLQRPSA